MIIYFFYSYFSTNNYTSVNGLQLDMAPDVGTLDVKNIVIDKNDNAEGSVQFMSESITGGSVTIRVVVIYWLMYVLQLAFS